MSEYPGLAWYTVNATSSVPSGRIHACSVDGFTACGLVPDGPRWWLATGKEHGVLAVDCPKCLRKLEAKP